MNSRVTGTQLCVNILVVIKLTILARLFMNGFIRVGFYKQMDKINIFRKKDNRLFIYQKLNEWTKKCLLVNPTLNNNEPFLTSYPTRPILSSFQDKVFLGL
ncbi:hypothetical protein R6Q59_024683 [Mikania micrantha]